MLVFTVSLLTGSLRSLEHLVVKGYKIKIAGGRKVTSSHKRMNNQQGHADEKRCCITFSDILKNEGTESTFLKPIKHMAWDCNPAGGTEGGR